MKMKRPLKLWAMACGMGLGLAAPALLNLVAGLGSHIPQRDMAADYITAVLWAMTLGMSILAWPVTARDKRALLWAWLAKSAVTLGIMLLYEDHYQVLDAYGYFNDSRRHLFAWSEFDIGAGSQNIVNLASMHHLILPESFHALKVSFAMVGLIGVYLFYRAAVIFLGREDTRIFYTLAFFPSILFWSSIFGKDPLALLGIAMYVYGVVGWQRHRQPRWLWVAILGIVVAAFVRIWLAPILLAPLFTYALLGVRGILRRAALVAFAGVASWFAFQQFMAVLSFASIDDILEAVSAVSDALSYGGSAQEIGTNLSSVRALLAFAPIGAFTALFRPLPGEILNPFGLLAGLENLALLLLLLLALRRTRREDLCEPVVLWALALVVTWAGVYGLISSHNLGAAVRFKLQILPVLLGLLLYLSRQRSNNACPEAVPEYRETSSAPQSS